jgi:hypothetical protein
MRKTSQTRETRSISPKKIARQSADADDRAGRQVKRRVVRRDGTASGADESVWQ